MSENEVGKNQGLAAGLVVGSILLATLALRLVHLNSGLWLDEILTLLEYARLPYAQIVTSFDSENQHFLYSLLAHSSILLFGESAWSLRLPAVLFGVGSIWATYVLGLEIANRREAILACALLSFSYHHLWFSQNARGYTGLLFWSLVSSWLLLRVLRAPSWRGWILYAIAAFLGVYTHLTMGFMIAGHFLVSLFYQFKKSRSKQKVDWMQWLIGFALAGMLVLAVHLPVIGQMQAVIGGSEASVVEEWKNPLWTLGQFLQGVRISSFAGLAGVLFLAVVIPGLASYFRSRPEFLGLVLIPPILGAIVTVSIGHHLWPRFFFFTFGFIVLVVIRGIMVTAAWFTRLTGFRRASPELLRTAVCLVLILLSALSMPSAYGPKQDFGGALGFLEKIASPDDHIVVVNLSTFPYRDYYQQDWTDVETADELREITARPGSTWLIYTFPEVLGSVYPEIMKLIQEEFILVKEFPGTVQSGTVYVMKSR